MLLRLNNLFLGVYYPNKINTHSHLRIRNMRHLMAIAATIVFIAMAKTTTAETTGALDQKLLSKLRSGYQMTEADRARFNAISNTSIDQLSLNREIVQGEDGHFSHKIATKGITDQKASGRCWMFVGSM